MTFLLDHLVINALFDMDGAAALMFRAADVCRIRDLAAPLSELRSGTDQRSLALLAPFLNTLLEFRSDR